MESIMPKKELGCWLERKDAINDINSTIKPTSRFISGSIKIELGFNQERINIQLKKNFKKFERKFSLEPSTYIIISISKFLNINYI